MTGPGLYCELHAHSCFSLLDGVPFPEALVERAAEVGMPAIALTDHDAVYGAVPFFARARELGVKPLLGVELTVANSRRLGGHLTLLAENQTGYQHLCQLVTLARAERPKGEAALPEELLPPLAGGLICLTGCRLGPVARPLSLQRPSEARAALGRLVEIFGRQSVYVEVQRSLGRDDKRLTHALAALAASAEFGLKCVATGNVHYLSREEGDLQDALVSIRVRAPLPQAGKHLRPNHEYFLRSSAAMLALYADLPEAVHNTAEVAQRCTVALPAGLQVLPVFPTPPGLMAQAYMAQLCQEQLPRYYRQGRPAAAAQALLEKELGMIEKLGLANYFLVVWDIINFCQRRGILCHGRGSAANSLVAHLLGISAVDPIAQGLVVERFLSVEHGGTPDIDLDIDAARREIVIQYVYDRWGRDHAAMACTYITYRSASSIRDAGYALGYKPEVIEELGAALEAQRRQKVPDADGRLEPPDVPLAEIASAAAALAGHKGQLNATTTQRLIDLAARLQKRPRHLGLHSGGMIITGDPIANLVPIEPATMEDRTVVQFDKEYLEELGIVKIDLLGLRMLAAISDAVELVRNGRGEIVDFRHLDFRDRAVFDLICSAHTIGIFQVESGAQVSVIPHLQPRCFQDLVVEISLIRPGPLQGNMVRPYLRRRQGLEPITYLHPDLKPALAETLGVIVFQEQVIKLARDFAGLAPGRGEVLRRALGKKHALDALAVFKDEFASGARGRGVGEAVIEQVWQMIANFAGYSFSKAHAAAFAVIVYWSAWLRVHYPVEYFCGLLRNAPLGTYPANVLESEARRVGVGFLPFDINRSLAKATVEAGGSRLDAGKEERRASAHFQAARSSSLQPPRRSNFRIRYGLDYVKGIG
ncbi:MAG: DNA polymerase III subunit alpha, partial [Anaerolineales bacterium]